MNATATHGAASAPTPSPAPAPSSRTRRATALALALAGPLVLAGVVLTPKDDGTAAGMLAAMGDHSARTQIGDLLLHFGWIAAALACVGLALLGGAGARRPGPLLLAGAALAAIGLTTLPGLFATDAYEIALAQELPRGQAVAISDQAASTPLAAFLFISGSLGAALGPVLLLAALWRRRIVSVAPWLLVLLGPLLSVIGDRGATAVIGAAMLAAGYALAAWQLTRARA